MKWRETTQRWVETAKETKKKKKSANASADSDMASSSMAIFILEDASSVQADNASMAVFMDTLSDWTNLGKHL